jgi:type II secretory pathway pseudopilin PulG
MTLVELLVVIAVFGTLISLLLPAIQAAREATRASQCKHYLRQQSQAVLLYADQRRGELPTLWRTARLRPWENFPWRVTVLPHLEQQPLYDVLNLEALPIAEVNRQSISTMLVVFQCPSTPDSPRRINELGIGPSTYTELQVAAHDYIGVHDVSTPAQQFPLRGAMNGGPDLQSVSEAYGGTPTEIGKYHRLSPQLRVMPGRLKLVDDGLSNTAMIVEQAGKPLAYNVGGAIADAAPTEGAWGAGDYSSIFADGVNRNNYSGVYGFHIGAHAAMADGSVHLWLAEMAPEVVVALLSRDAGEIVTASDWR